MPRYQVQLSGRKGAQWCCSFVTKKAKSPEEAEQLALKSNELTEVRVVQALELSKNYNRTLPF